MPSFQDVLATLFMEGIAEPAGDSEFVRAVDGESGTARRDLSPPEPEGLSR